MSRTDESLRELLLVVLVELDAATTTDTVSLARPRAKLAWIATLLPEQRAQARRLLDFAAEVASAIGLSVATADDDLHRLAATRAAVDAVMACLTESDVLANDLLIIQAGQQLLRTVGRDPTLWQRNGEARNVA